MAKKPDADGGFDNSLNWYFNDGELHFDNNWTDNANQNFGSAVGFFSLRLFQGIRKALDMPELFQLLH